MKRLLMVALCLCVALCACSVPFEVETPVPDDVSGAPESSTPQPETIWMPYSPDEIGGRYYEEPTFELVPQSDYGTLYPYSVPAYSNDGMSFSLYGLVDSRGRVVVDPCYSSATRMTFYDYDRDIYTPTNLYRLEKTEGDGRPVSQLTTLDGSYVSEAYSSVYTVGQGIVVCQGGGVSEDGEYLYGLLDAQGQTLLPCQYSTIEAYSEGLALIWSPEEGSFFVDRQGNRVFSQRFNAAYGFSEGLAAVREDDRFGYIDTSGRYVVEPAYEVAERFHNGYAIVGDKNGGFGVIDSQGRVVVPLTYEMLYYQYGYYLSYENNTRNCFEIVNGAPVDLGLFFDWVSDERGVTITDRGRTFRLEGIDGIDPVAEDVYIAYAQEDEQTKWGLVTTDGTWIVPPGDRQLSLFDWTQPRNKDGLLLIQEQTDRGWKCGLLDMRGQVILPAEYDKIEPTGDLFSVWRGNYTGLLDTDGVWLFKQSLLAYRPD